MLINRKRSQGHLALRLFVRVTPCRIGASQTSVLVTEWLAAEKSNLESLIRGGAVAVEFSGCSLRLIPECQLGGAYGWQRTTTTSDTVEIANEAQLYTKLPLGALSLAGELKRSGTLYVQTMVAGHMRLGGFTSAQVPNTQECSYASHVIDGLALGAFILSAGGTVSASASATATIGEAGGSASQTARVVRAAGDAATCSGSTEQGAANGCGSPVQVFLSPIPGRAEEPAPPGTVKVDFVSSDGDTRWDVYLNDEATCTTPCARWLEPSRPITLRSRGGSRATKLTVRRLDPMAGPLQVVAKPTSKGKLATGITFTALGGLALVTGTGHDLQLDFVAVAVVQDQFVKRLRAGAV